MSDLRASERILKEYSSKRFNIDKFDKFHFFNKIHMFSFLFHPSIERDRMRFSTNIKNLNFSAPKGLTNRPLANSQFNESDLRRLLTPPDSLRNVKLNDRK